MILLRLAASSPVATCARFEGGARDATDATDRFVEEQLSRSQSCMGTVR